jgi:hypothetical protein
MGRNIFLVNREKRYNSDAFGLNNKKPLYLGVFEWAEQDSNLRPHRCKGL